MDQLNLLDDDRVNIQTANELDVTRYDADRGDCKHPNLHPQSAYRYGCRCIGCRKYRSAWSARLALGPQQCGVDGCEQPRRRVQGAKYCADHATSLKYKITGQYHTLKTQMVCLICENEVWVNKSKTMPICSQCWDQNGKLMSSARTHHASVELIVKWAKRPHCDLCDRPLYVGRGSGRSGMVIDHDHSCCHGGASCGRCIRGILCAACNMSLGHVESMIDKASLPKMLAYLGSCSSQDGHAPSRTAQNWPSL